MALAAAVMMQVVTNLQNDVGYTERGGETGARVGLPRATARGWLSPRDVKRAIVAAIAVAQLVALPLMIRGGWPIVATSVASTAAAWAYMGGPRPIAYTPLGELTVFVFFGLVAVAGSYFVQAGTIAAAAWIAAVAIGMHAAAVLLVNNYRDREHDRSDAQDHPRRAARPRRRAKASTRSSCMAPFALAAGLAWNAGSAWFALPLAALPWGWRLQRELARTAPGTALNALLFRTVLLEVAFGLLLSAGALLHAAR